MKGVRQIDWYRRLFFTAPSFLTLQLKSKAPPGVIEGRRVFESQLKKYIRSKVERIKSLNSKVCSFKEDILCLSAGMKESQKEGVWDTFHTCSTFQTPTIKNMWPVCLDISEVPQKEFNYDLNEHFILFEKDSGVAETQDCLRVKNGQVACFVYLAIHPWPIPTWQISEAVLMHTKSIQRCT